MKKLLLSCLALATGVASFAYDVEINGIFYNLNNTNLTATVTYNGTAYNNGTFIGNVSGNTYTGEIKIPDSVTYDTKTYNVTSIGDYAFMDCLGIISISIPQSVTSIGDYPFPLRYTFTLILEGKTPPIIENQISFLDDGPIIVPDEAYNTYCTEWSNKISLSRIVPLSKKEKIEQSVNITASDNTSALLTAVGEESVKYIRRLKITGSINSYDFMVMNNKMTNLRYLDLSKARVVANPYEFYSGVCTANDVWPRYAFYQKTTLREVLLPESVHSIGSYAFSDCENLKSVFIGNSVRTIGNYAFYNSGLDSVSIPNSVISIGESVFRDCSWLSEVTIGNGVTSIGYGTFYNSSLSSITIPNNVNSIGSYAFYNCYRLKSVSIGNSVTSIGNNAFERCNNFKILNIPSSVLTIGSNAFSSCYLDTIYTYTIEPTSINQETFSCYETAVLAVPEQSYYNYYWDTQWSQFTEIVEFNEPYDNFYLKGDYTSDDNTGRIDGNPDVTQYENSGYIVEGNEMQSTGDLEIKHDGTHGGSVIANNNLSADSLRFCINITANKWYFFSFPFDVNLRKCITYPGNFVFRYYDGDERAQYGHGGWKNVEGHHLHAGHGYIFQGDQSGKLILSWKDIIFKGENKRDTLHQHQSNNSCDKSWNFVGNPHCSYYGIKDMNYNAPITVWNGSTYVAYNPTDDDYYLHPFQAFFVQCPEDVEGIDFDKEHRKTKNGSEKAKAQKLTMSRMATQIDVERQLVNLTISNDSLSDRTRIVFNNQKSMDYEMECDAAKFISTEAPQIYSLDTKDVKYAINERPLSAGTVDLGYSVSQAGVYKIAAPRMDCEVELEDKESGAEFNLTLGDYEFTSEAGTFENRFVLRIVNAVTKVETTFAEAGVKVLSTPEGILIEGAEQNDVRIYDVRGQLLQTVDTSDLIRLPKAIYIVRVGQQSTKVVVK